MVMLKQTIRPEFLNRIDEVIMFQPLMKKDIRNIIKIQLGGLIKSVLETGIRLEFSDYALDYLSENGFDPQFGARPLNRAIQKYVEDPLAEFILGENPEKGSKLLAEINEEKNELNDIIQQESIQMRNKFLSCIIEANNYSNSLNEKFYYQIIENNHDTATSSTSAYNQINMILDG
jgi:ATP-dependent Clp protease ATP-binding subunit ClpA